MYVCMCKYCSMKLCMLSKNEYVYECMYVCILYVCMNVYFNEYVCMYVCMYVRKIVLRGKRSYRTRRS